MLPPCPVPALTPHLKAYYGDPPSSEIWLTCRKRNKAGPKTRARPISGDRAGRFPLVSASVGVTRGMCQCWWAASLVMCQCCQQTCAKQKHFSPHVERLQSASQTCVSRKAVKGNQELRVRVADYTGLEQPIYKVARCCLGFGGRSGLVLKQLSRSDFTQTSCERGSFAFSPLSLSML